MENKCKITVTSVEFGMYETIEDFYYFSNESLRNECFEKIKKNYYQRVVKDNEGNQSDDEREFYSKNGNWKYVIAKSGIKILKTLEKFSQESNNFYS